MTTTSPTTRLSISDPQELLDYVNGVAAVSSYAAAVAQSRLPALVMTPSWYTSYADQFTQCQVHALNWLNGDLLELNILPQALLDADPLVSAQLAQTQQALQAMAADPANPAHRQAAQRAVAALSSTVAPVQKSLDDLQGAVTDFSAQLGPDVETLTNLSAAAAAAGGTDSAEVAQLTDVIGQLQAAIQTRQQIARLQDLLEGDLSVFLTVLGTTVGWMGGPVGEGIVGVAAIGLTAAFASMLGDAPDITALQQEITNVQQEIAVVNTEVAILQATVNGFAALADQASQAGGGLVEVAQTWSGEVAAIDAIAADLAAAGTDVDHSLVSAALLAVRNVSLLWEEMLVAMKILAGVTYQVAKAPIPIGS